MAEAADTRLALLVGNEYGWRADPKLKYVLNGDLYPLARKLRGLGFEVKLLVNPDVQGVRRALVEVQNRLKRAPKIDTLLFYYSGHADQSHFHFGAKSPRPMSYKEFSKFFSRLRVTRRIAILDSCYSGEVIRQFGGLKQYKRLLRRGGSKGVLRKRHKIDLKKFLVPNQGHEQGIRIISSSLSLAWELKTYRASVFTFHLLRGMGGRADMNRDGKISWDELFDYTSRKVIQDTNQKPQQFLLLTRRSPYALAPAYGSRLWIGPKVSGEIKVVVANFLWQKRKRANRVVRLAVIPGAGQVFLQRRNKCLHQSIRLRKGGELRLSNAWRVLPCRKLAKFQKGLIPMPARIFRETRVSTQPSDWSLSLGGEMFIAQLVPGWLMGGAALTLRHPWFALHFGAWGLSTPTTQQHNYELLMLSLQAQLGYTWTLRHFALFTGGYVSFVLSVDDLRRRVGVAPLFWYGAVLAATYRLTPRISLFFEVKPGAMLGVLQSLFLHRFAMTCGVGVRVRL